MIIQKLRLISFNHINFTAINLDIRNNSYFHYLWSKYNEVNNFSI